jgi:tetratricopeptide (TPR) repeat protein
MARRIPIALVTVALFYAPAATAQTVSPSILVQYSFDDNVLDTGPDTFAVFQKAKGSVRLHTQNRLSGYHSIEIRDVAGDHDFPELQGYFAPRSRGKLFLHFAFMTTNAAEEFNIALAGPEWFTLRQNGIGFWLKAIEGYLCHYSDSIPKKLFAIRPFVWYIVNAAYDVDAGTYDLTIHEEGQLQPVVSLDGQANAPNQAGSTVDKFSFIGDAGTDDSNVVYYVDDVIVGVDRSVTQIPFVAPGRRRLFVDYWDDQQRAFYGQPRALPVTDLTDFGIGSSEFAALQTAGLWDLLRRIIAGELETIPGETSDENRRLLEAVVAWRKGVAALHAGNHSMAFSSFEKARALVPNGKVYAMNSVLASAALADWGQVDARLREIYPDWRDDMRFPAALAMIGMARQDLESAEQLLRESTEEPLTEQYFYALLWQKKFSQAEQFGQRMVERSRESGKPFSGWLERLGDAAFMVGDFNSALQKYEESSELDRGRIPARIFLKLSDVYFRLGDLDRERHYREMIYGRLN